MKKYFYKKSRISLVVCLLFVAFSCETTDLDINDNPNQLTVDQADPSFILNGIQFSLVGQHFGLSATTRGTMRQVHQFGSYAQGAGPGALNGAWTTVYSIGNNKRLLEEIGQTSELRTHIGIAKVVEAFAYVNLVDYLGSAVYTEALNSVEFPQPNFDSGESIYDAMYAQLNDAITDLNAQEQLQAEDLFFNGDNSKWVKLANTLKIKMYVQTKLVTNSSALADLNAIIASGNFIVDSSDDFFAAFNQNAVNPDTRHPDFVGQYEVNAGGQYMSNDFMNTLLRGKSIEDPRLKYYIYRQDLNAPSGDKLPCEGEAGFQYCYIGNGYWGRDHGDDEGIPNDGADRATFGIYPAGGAFDSARSIGVIEQEAIDTYDPSSDLTLAEYTAQLLSSENPATAESSNLGGAGIHPMILSSFTHFMLAEAALPAPQGLGATGDSRGLLSVGMQQSFDIVANFAGIAMDATAVSAYIAEVLAEYDAASSDQKLEIIIREYYIALWGNGIETYNNYRRTGYPELGFSVISNTDFPRSFFIPENELNANDNPDLVQKELTDQLFWDTNPAGFID